MMTEAVNPVLTMRPAVLLCGENACEVSMEHIESARLYAVVYSLKLLACPRRIRGEGLVEVHDDSGKNAE